MGNLAASPTLANNLLTEASPGLTPPGNRRIRSSTISDNERYTLALTGPLIYTARHSTTTDSVFRIGRVPA